MRQHSDSTVILDRYVEALFMRWLDHESGRWQPPAPPTPVAGARYHGAR
ncbi:MAG TPA: hypothetical protein VF970_06780 [Gemmatimonadales bacterium]